MIISISTTKKIPIDRLLIIVFNYNKYLISMNQDEFNKYALLAVLELLTTSQKFLNAYIQKYPTNETHALSFSVDPGCDCRGDIIKHYEENTNDVNLFTHEFIENNSTELNWADFVRRHQTTPVAGKVVKIEKTSEAYANLIQQMHNERWVFRHMNVTTDDNAYVIFFA